MSRSETKGKHRPPWFRPGCPITASGILNDDEVISEVVRPGVSTHAACILLRYRRLLFSHASELLLLQLPSEEFRRIGACPA
jgi:hypothetical protein